jgi:hypothetical protein
LSHEWVEVLDHLHKDSDVSVDKFGWTVGYYEGSVSASSIACRRRRRTRCPQRQYRQWPLPPLLRATIARSVMRRFRSKS